MSEDGYKKLAKVLDTLPNGFPESDNGVEIKILKLIFTPEDAEVFCDMRLSFETADQIAERTGRSLDGLNDHLRKMWGKGQIFGVDFGEVTLYKIAPWVFGIFEFQLKRMTKEFAVLCKEYEKTFGPQFFQSKVPLMNVVPVEKEISSNEVTMPFEQVSSIIEKGKSFAVNDCICKKEHELLGERCDKPMEVCLAIAPIPNFFDDHPLKARPISKEEAYDILKMSEEAGLVHLTSNIERGHYYICNCCSCCCGVLRGVNEYGGAKAVNSNYYAVIDAEECVSCGVCMDERCQVHAIEEKDEVYAVIEDKCIGCGLCVSTCPSDAISLIRKNAEDIVLPPVDENDWYKRRSQMRGVDYSKYA
ncbi:MAG: 4Fe-4S binding protein [Desulfobacteraceae bacterium]|jgi:electron transport complex protein RnfB|nr:4Fe-4S binding protein [Desulfobacteraceae bacterium]